MQSLLPVTGLRLPLLCHIASLPLMATSRGGLLSSMTSRHGTEHSHREIYTTDFTCLENNCLNPVVPGLMYLGSNVLDQHKNLHWSCADLKHTPALWRLGGFCSRIIAAYPFAMPQASPYGGTSEADTIFQQAQKALETYVGHISAMGFDFWDYTQPWDLTGEDSECIKSVWKMSCYTHFPRCSEIHPGEYLPPCRSSCEDYLKVCNVQCCDEGVQCSFTHARKMADGSTVYEHGYPNHKGPSPLCTGGHNGTKQRIPGVLAVLVVALLAAIHH